MGIRDLNLDLSEYAENILILTPDSQQALELSSLLSKRGYLPTTALSIEEASVKAKKNLFDLMIVDLQDCQDIRKYCQSLTSESSLSRLILVFLHPLADAILPELQDFSDGQYQVVGLPLERAELLLKVATRLRLRKLKAEEARGQAPIVEQNALLRDLTTRYKKELKEAQEIQRALLPQTMPDDATCSFSVRYLPLEAVGGDLYDVFSLPYLDTSQRYAFLIADVSGHGLPAAFIGAMTKMALAASKMTDPGQTLTEMNTILGNYLPPGRFVTSALLFYDTASHTLQYCSSGHIPGFFFSAATESVTLLKVQGPPLGVSADTTYESTLVSLAPGDKLLLLTDGITETHNLAREVLGIDRCRQEFENGAKKFPIAQCLEELLCFRERFAEGRILKDDITLLGFQVIA